MPVISTLGALSYDKVPLTTDTTGNSWLMLIGNNTSFTSSTFASNALFLGGRSTASGTDQAAVFKVSQDFSPVISFQNNGTFYQRPEMMIPAYNGDGIAITGAVSIPLLNGFFAKVNSSGTYTAGIRYAGPSISGAVQARENDSVAYDSLGNYYIASWTRESVAVGYVMTLSKFDTTNTLIWTKVFYQVGAIVTNVNTRNLARVKVDNFDNVYIFYGALATSPGGQNYYKLLKFSTSGTLVFQTRFDFGAQDAAFDLDSQNNIYVMYKVSSVSYITKFNSTMTSQWTINLATSPATTFQWTDLPDIPIRYYNNNLYVTFSTSTNFNNYLVSIDTNGNLNWSTKIQYLVSGVNQPVAPDTFTMQESSIYTAFNTSSSQAQLVKLPIDGSIPGTGNYTISANTYMTYSLGNIISTTTSPIGTTAGNITIINGNTASVTSVGGGSAGNIATYSVISL
jgi:hypothetical protein